MSTRTYVVTGAASGIGRATAELLRDRGHRVIGVDLQDTDVVADLSHDAGRQDVVRQVGDLSGGVVDAVLAVAGLSSNTVATAQVNYFGTVATLTGLRPLLANSPAPRAVAVASVAVLQPDDPTLAAALEADDEAAALVRAGELAALGGHAIYAGTKRAVARWVRRHAPGPDWAGHGIALNAVAPGIVATPMMAEQLGTEEGRAAVTRSVPMPLNGIATAEAVAEVIAWLAGAANSHVCGQVLFVDGGTEAIVRGDGTFPAR